MAPLHVQPAQKHPPRAIAAGFFISAPEPAREGAMGTVPKTAGKKPQPKGGSRKGIPNKSTATAREAIARFVDGNTERLQEWLDQIAADDRHGPREAFRCLMDVMEYHVPKLARTEHVGEGGGAVKQSLTVTFVKP